MEEKKSTLPLAHRLSMRDNARPSPHGPCAGARGGPRSPRRQHSSATAPRPTGHFNPGQKRLRHAPSSQIAAQTVSSSRPSPMGCGAATTSNIGNLAQDPHPRRVTLVRAPFRPRPAKCVQDEPSLQGDRDNHHRGTAPHATRPALLPHQPALMPLAATSSNTTPPQPRRPLQLGPVAPAPLGTRATRTAWRAPGPSGSGKQHPRGEVCWPPVASLPGPLQSARRADPRAGLRARSCPPAPPAPT